MCGKNLSSFLSPPSITGSPPRVREERGIRSVRTGKARITPACAGRTSRYSYHALRLQGSPPRVREEHLRSPRCIIKRGITPACAGRTFFCSVRIHMTGDHPRVCGKNFRIFLIFFFPPGSPPRVREERHRRSESK